MCFVSFIFVQLLKLQLGISRQIGITVESSCGSQQKLIHDYHDQRPFCGNQD